MLTAAQVAVAAQAARSTTVLQIVHQITAAQQIAQMAVAAA